MIGFDSDITIFNKRYSPEMRLDEWHRTQLSGVSFYGGQKTSMTDGGRVSSDVYIVRIPEDTLAGYVPPHEFNAQGAPGTWTIQSDDIIVKGLYDGDMTRPADILALDHSFVVTNWYDNRRGLLSHMKIEGK